MKVLDKDRVHKEVIARSVWGNIIHGDNFDKGIENRYVHLEEHVRDRIARKYWQIYEKVLKKAKKIESVINSSNDIVVHGFKELPGFVGGSTVLHNAIHTCCYCRNGFSFDNFKKHRCKWNRDRLKFASIGEKFEKYVRANGTSTTFTSDNFNISVDKLKDFASTEPRYQYVIWVIRKECLRDHWYTYYPGRHKYFD